MGKRFTDTDLFDKAFFRRLPVPYKLFWFYLYHNCDYAGLYSPDLDKINFHFNHEIHIDLNQALKLFNAEETRIIPVDGGKKWFIAGFIEFQYVKLSRAARNHSFVIKRLEKYGLLDENLNVKNQAPNKPLRRGLQGAKESRYKNKEKLEGGPGGNLAPPITPGPGYLMEFTTEEMNQCILFFRSLNGEVYTKNQVTEMFKAFALNAFDGEKQYNNRNAILSHFRNSVKYELKHNAPRINAKQSAAQFASELFTNHKSQLDALFNADGNPAD